MNPESKPPLDPDHNIVVLNFEGYSHAKHRGKQYTVNWATLHQTSLRGWQSFLGARFQLPLDDVSKADACRQRQRSELTTFFGHTTDCLPGRFHFFSVFSDQLRCSRHWLTFCGPSVLDARNFLVLLNPKPVRWKGVWWAMNNLWRARLFLNVILNVKRLTVGHPLFRV